MKKFLARVEHAAVRLLLAPELRPLEKALLRSAALKVLVRVGAGSAVTALVLELIGRLG